MDFLETFAKLEKTAEELEVSRAKSSKFMEEYFAYVLKGIKKAKLEDVIYLDSPEMMLFKKESGEQEKHQTNETTLSEENDRTTRKKRNAAKKALVGINAGNKLLNTKKLRRPTELDDEKKRLVEGPAPKTRKKKETIQENNLDSSSLEREESDIDEVAMKIDADEEGGHDEECVDADVHFDKTLTTVHCDKTLTPSKEEKIENICALESEEILMNESNKENNCANDEIPSTSDGDQQDAECENHTPQFVDHEKNLSLHNEEINENMYSPSESEMNNVNKSDEEKTIENVPPSISNIDQQKVECGNAELHSDNTVVLVNCNKTVTLYKNETNKNIHAPESEESEKNKEASGELLLSKAEQKLVLQYDVMDSLESIGSKTKEISSASKVPVRNPLVNRNKIYTPVTGKQPVSAAKPPIRKVKKIKAEDVEKRRREELIKNKQKEEEALKNKEELIKAKKEELKRKREYKLQKVFATKEAVEKQKLEKLAKLEKEKEEREKLRKKEIEREKEELLKKRQINLQKAQEAEERRVREEKLRLERIREQEEEQKKLVQIKLKQQEEADRLMLQRRLEEEKRAKEDLLKNHKDPPKLKPNTNSHNESCSSYELTPHKLEREPVGLVDPENYCIDDLRIEDSEDEDNPMKKIPFWSKKSVRNTTLKTQVYLVKGIISSIFQYPSKTPDLKEFFGKHIKERVRTSSAIWNIPPAIERN